MAADYLIISAEALFERKGLSYPWAIDVLACKKNGVQISVKSKPYVLGTWSGSPKEKRKKKGHDIPDSMLV